MSNSCMIYNVARQGGILSLKLFSSYVDDLSASLINCKVCCHIGDDYNNHVMYAVDICHVAPSPEALTECYLLYL